MTGKRGRPKKYDDDMATVSARVPAPMKAELDSKADALQISQNDAVLRALTEFVDESRVVVPMSDILKRRFKSKADGYGMKFEDAVCEALWEWVDENINVIAPAEVSAPADSVVVSKTSQGFASADDFLAKIAANKSPVEKISDVASVPAVQDGPTPNQSAWFRELSRVNSIMGSDVAAGHEEWAIVVYKNKLKGDLAGWPFLPSSSKTWERAQKLAEKYIHGQE